MTSASPNISHALRVATGRESTIANGAPPCSRRSGDGSEKSRAYSTSACGNGTYLAGIREALDPKFLLGADLSFRMAQEAARRGVTKTIVAGDAALLPFRSASFRAIFCSHVLQFVADLPRCIAEIARCLAPGGTFTIAGGELGVGQRLKMLLGDMRWAAFRAELPRPRDVRVRRSLADYQAAAQQAGLSVDPQRVEFIVTWADLDRKSVV